MDLITIIIPVYNVEKYLDKCINSITNQSYTYLEIILVDDGSPDNCPQLCDEWAKKDDRIKVIHKENGGLSDARNAGLAISNGNYIAFVDSDDWVHKDYILNLYSAIKKYNADISACDVQIVYDDDQPISEASLPDITLFTPEEALQTLITGCKFRAVAWNKLFLKDLLVGEHFEVGRYHEDEFFTYRILAKAKKLSYIDSKLYYYYQRSGSIMNSISIKHLDALDAYMERLDFFKKNFPNLYYNDKITVCISLINAYIDALSAHKKTRKDIFRKIKEHRLKIIFTNEEMTTLSTNNKIYIIMSSINIGLFARILRFKRMIVSNKLPY